MKNLEIPTKRGTVLDGVLFCETKDPDSILISITGIHGKFKSNPFYINIGHTLNKGNIDFIYAQTCDAIRKITKKNILTGEEEIIGSFNEDFNNTEDDVEAYINYAAKNNYKHIYLAGHSLGANKIIYYLSKNHDERVEKYILLSPANIINLINKISEKDKIIIKEYKEKGKDNEVIPFQLFGWVECITKTAYDWVYNNILDNVHVEKDADFSQINNITHSGAMIIGTYDRFTCGDPTGFLENINKHTKNPDKNKLLFIEKTGHVYKRKEQELSDILLNLINEWKTPKNEI